ncbi:MAG: aminomethyl-transferring glycine dehydrogenase subunit GcvPA [bacterium]
MPSYAPHTPADIAAMLAAIGVASVEDLFSHLPPKVRLGRALDLPAGMDEGSLYLHLVELSQRNKAYLPPQQLMGAGLYAAYQPSLLDVFFNRSEFLTSYTPYQPEIAQGTLQALFEYQTMICELTGLAISNASSYDGSTALGDALGLLAGFGRDGARVLVSDGLYDQYRQVLDTYNYGLGLAIATVADANGHLDLDALKSAIGTGVRAVIIQSPNRFGIVESPAVIHELAEAVHTAGGLLIQASDPLSLALLTPPGETGVDIAVGEAQVFGNTPNFGGPVCGYFAVTDALMRRLPGRVVGETVDAEGRRAYVLTLTAREQHIRREKATSNLCTSQALNAMGAMSYMAFFGKQGLPALALRIAALTHAAMLGLSAVDGCCLPYNSQPHFREFAVTVRGRSAGEINCRLCGHGFSSGIPLDNERVLITLNETHDQATIDRLVAAIQSFNQTSPAASPAVSAVEPVEVAS